MNKPQEGQIDMNNIFTALVWSLEVLIFSYRTVLALAGFIALWAWLAYEWLGLPESSTFMLILALFWAIALLLAAAVIFGGTVSGAVNAAGAEGMDLHVSSLWKPRRGKTSSLLIFSAMCGVLGGLFAKIFGWIDAHLLEVASFFTFHSGRPISYEQIGEFVGVIEGLLWVVLSGYLLSLFAALLREGWRDAGKQSLKLLPKCAFQGQFLASLLSVGAFGGVAYKLANWHRWVPPGFWDYAQVLVRFSLALIVIAAGLCFWSLFLARLQVPRANPAED